LQRINSLFIHTKSKNFEQFYNFFDSVSIFSIKQMAKANEKYFRNEIIPELVNRFENMIKNRTQYYFDISEFENLIEFYIESSNIINATIAAKYGCTQHPHSPVLKLKNAQLLLDNGHIEKALMLANDLEKIEPSEFEIYILKANCYLELEKSENAEKEFNKAIENYNSSLDEAYHDIGYIYMNYEKYSLALKYLRKAVESKPTNYAAVFDYAYINFLTENYEESIDSYNFYLKRYPLSEQAWNNLGNVYATLGNKKQAIEAFDYSISINKQFQNPYLAKAEILFSNNEFQKAINTYKELLEKDITNNSVYFLIADCYQNLEEYIEAIKYYKKSIEIDSDFADSWYSIANILYKLKKHATALKFVEKAIELDSYEAEFWFLAAQISSEIGTFQTTSRYFKKALELDPNYVDAWIAYSEYCYTKNFIDSGIQILQEAIRHNKKDSFLHYALSLFYLDSKNNKSAIYHFQIAANLNFNFQKLFFEYYPIAAKNKVFKQITKAINERLDSRHKIIA